MIDSYYLSYANMAYSDCSHHKDQALCILNVVPFDSTLPLPYYVTLHQFGLDILCSSRHEQPTTNPHTKGKYVDISRHDPLPLQIINHHIPADEHPAPAKPKHLSLVREDHGSERFGVVAEAADEYDAVRPPILRVSPCLSCGSLEVGRDGAGEVGEEGDGRVEDGDVFSGAGDGC